MTTFGEYVGKAVKLERLRAWVALAETAHQLLNAAGAQDAGRARELLARAGGQLDAIDRLEAAP